MMNKEEICQYLKKHDIVYEIVEHQAIENMKEAAQIDFPYPEVEAKNLFVRDDKKRHYYLITVKGNKRVDLKKIKQLYQTRSLSFASENDLMKILKLTPGSVTPFGLLNDEQLKVHFFIDQDFFDEPFYIGIHPNDNRATVFLKTEDLCHLIQEHGQTVTMIHV